MMNITRPQFQITQQVGKILKLAALSVGAMCLLSSAAPAATPDRPDEFDAIASGKFLLLDFYQQYCGTCQMMKPYVNALPDKTNGKLVLKHIDIGQPANRNYISSFSITGTPTYVLYNPSGKAVYRMQDTLSPKILEQNVLQQIHAAEVTSMPSPKAASN